MNIKLLIIFIVLSIVNVILQTVKSIVTIKCGKVSASVVNAIAFGLYTIVTVYTMCDLPLFIKALVVALCNLVGVFIVKSIEEKTRKDKIWKIECSVKQKDVPSIKNDLDVCDIPYNVVNASNCNIFNIYSENQTISDKVKKILSNYNVKYFVTETKIL